MAPAELEQSLLNHPDVTDAAVVGAKLYVSTSKPCYTIIIYLILGAGMGESILEHLLFGKKGL